MIMAAMFNAAGEAVKLMSGSARQLNLNIPPGGTWRPVGATADLSEVPPLDSLDPHPDLAEPA